MRTACGSHASRPTLRTALIAELELRHRLRARVEDRIRAARSTGLRNLPLHHSAQNRVWLEIVQIALDLLARMPMLALTGPARLWEPRRLRFRLFTAAGQLVTTGRRRILRIARHWPGPVRSQAPSNVSHSCRTPADQQSSRPYEGASTDRSSGTRRPPETTHGSSARPPSSTESETAHRLRRRTVTKDRGE